MGEVFLLFWEVRGCYRVRLTRPIGGAGRGAICEALPSDCAPAGGVTRQGCNVVGNDPCVVPFFFVGGVKNDSMFGLRDVFVLS